MTRPILRSLAAAAIVGAAAACGHAGAAPPPIPFYQPVVALRDVRLRGVGLLGGALDLWMSVYNPNTYDIVSPRVQYVVMVDRVQVASGFADLDVVVPARDSMDVRVPAEFTYNDLGPAGRAILGRGAAMYRVMGRVTVGTPYGRLSFPYDRAGQYGMMDVGMDRPRRDHDARDVPRRDHGDEDAGRGDGREHERGLAPVRSPDPRDRHDGSAAGPSRHPDAGDEHDARDGRDAHDAHDAHYAHGPHDAREAHDARDGHDTRDAHDAPAAHDTPSGPESHQPREHAPGHDGVRVGNPGEGRRPAPVRPDSAPGRRAQPPVAGHPVHPGGGEHAPPPPDSNPRAVKGGGKPCPPPEPSGGGGAGRAQPHGQRVPRPCVVPDSAGRKSKHQPGKAAQR